MRFTHNWLRTLTLLERNRALPKNGHSAHNGHSEDGTPTANLPARVYRWSSQPPFDSSFPFAERLAADGLTEQTFSHLLTESTEDLGARFPEIPSWLMTFIDSWCGNSAVAPSAETGPLARFAGDEVRIVLRPTRVYATMQWCHGAPGIGLARLNSHQDDPQFETEIEAALHTTLNRGFGNNHSLCYGDLGNIELLLQASQKLNSGYWQAQVNSVSRQILDGIIQHGWVGENH
jgi:hypothetical protein